MGGHATSRAAVACCGAVCQRGLMRIGLHFSCDILRTERASRTQSTCLARPRPSSEIVKELEDMEVMLRELLQVLKGGWRGARHACLWAAADAGVMRGSRPDAARLGGDGPCCGR